MGALFTKENGPMAFVVGLIVFAWISFLSVILA